MKIDLFQELLALNEEFGHVIHGLEGMEQEPTYKKEMIRSAKAHIESAQVEANRQFFDEFDSIVENDAIETYKFLRDHRKRVTDPDDVYLEIKQREAASKAKRLPPRVAILPDWHFGDEKRYGEEQAEKKKRSAKRRRKRTQKRRPKLAKPPQLQTANSKRDATPSPFNQGWVQVLSRQLGPSAMAVLSTFRGEGGRRRGMAGAAPVHCGNEGQT